MDTAYLMGESARSFWVQFLLSDKLPSIVTVQRSDGLSDVSEDVALDKDLSELVSRKTNHREVAEVHIENDLAA
jgi:hypothetical protein